MTSSRYRWTVVFLFFVFMFLHQVDKLLIGPLTTPIMETFGIQEDLMGAVFTGALIVGAVCYPLWGYLYDRFVRSKLLALASFIWGATTWLSALAPTYGAFVATRASTGIDDSSYPGLYSLVSDYFEPRMRGRIIGLLELSMPLGYLAGTVLATMLAPQIGWRNVFYLTGSLGILLAVVIFFAVREPARGRSEPEMEGLEQIRTYRFDWKVARGLFRKLTLRLMFIQGFFGVFPWQVITYWFFRYLETERFYGPEDVLLTMAPAVLVLASGYFVGGALGDRLFRRTPRGRLIVPTVAVLVGAVLLLVTVLAIPVPEAAALRQVERQAQDSWLRAFFLDRPVPPEPGWIKPTFLVMLCLTAFFIPFAAPNVVSTIYDITLPEVRSTALSVQYFIESAGAATAPLLAGLIAVRSSLQNAILLICVSAWVLCAFFFIFATLLVPQDIAVLRRQMRERAEQERAAQAVRGG